MSECNILSDTQEICPRHGHSHAANSPTSTEPTDDGRSPDGSGSRPSGRASKAVSPVERDPKTLAAQIIADFRHNQLGVTYSRKRLSVMAIDEMLADHILEVIEPVWAARQRAVPQADAQTPGGAGSR